MVSAAALAQAPSAADRASSPVARSVAGGTAWAKLTPQQRQILGPLERDWPSLDASRKSKWLEVATRFPTMPAADQQRVQQRMAEWARMSPTERGRARLSFQESKQFSTEQKQARWEAYQALPDEQRRALANRSLPLDNLPHGPSAMTPAPNTAQPRSSAASRASASAPAAKPVAPTLVQAKPGATTTLMTIAAEPPAHHRPGQPKIAAQPGQVNSSTLLPQSGPQAAASSTQLP